MATDFSRVRLNPLLDYAGVALKQGGVLLDADANELADILDRRLRALASDTLGRSTVSSTTPDAFKITAAGGTLQIGKGRLYVDGLLAENHGAKSTLPAQRMFDELLAEPQFTNAIGYAAQPYLPQPPALPTAGRHLVYLDVWNREVTFLEEPKLVESAVGVETASRIQTVWQVRTLADNQPASVTCATPDADVLGWDALTAPSTGVLSTGTFDVAPANDPASCPRPAAIAGSRTSSTGLKSTMPAPPAAVPASSGRAKMPASAAASPPSSRPPSWSSKASAATTCCRSRTATGSRYSTTRASSRNCPARCGRSPWSPHRAV